MVVAVSKDRGKNVLDGAARGGGDEFPKNRFSQLARALLLRPAQLGRVAEVGRASQARLPVHVVQQRRDDLVLELNKDEGLKDWDGLNFKFSHASPKSKFKDV